MPLVKLFCINPKSYLAYLSAQIVPSRTDLLRLTTLPTWPLDSHSSSHGLSLSTTPDQSLYWNKSSYSVSSYAFQAYMS